MDKKTKELLVKMAGQPDSLRNHKDIIQRIESIIKKITRILGIMKIT